MKNLSALGVLALVLSTGQAVADPVPANRRADWTYTGVPGGIPNRTTICATFSPGATASQINNAISNCNNGVVFLNAGTYSAASLGGSISLAKSNVTLRGAGADKTILTGGWNVVSVGSGGNVALGAAITGGGLKGAKQITVASTANLAVGTMIEVDREDDPNLVVGPTQNGTRNITQMNVITAISGNTVTVRNPWFYDFSTGTPKVKFYFTWITRNSGVENLKFDHAGFTGATTNFGYCDSCWLKGVESANSSGYHFTFQATLNTELRDNYVHDGASGPNNSGFNFYGQYKWGSNSSARVENNIFNKNFPAIELNGSASGFYIGYNYSYGSPSQYGTNMVTWTFDDGHAPFNIMNLYEGNIGEMWGMDGYYGGSGLGVLARNYFTGYNPNYGVKGDAIQLKRLGYQYSFVGNVLGSAQQSPTAYATGCDVPNVFQLGYPNIGNCSTSPYDGVAVPGGYPDAKVGSTLLRWGNYDYFNNAPQFLTSEIPSGVAVPADQLIPASYVYAGKPAWWGASVPWPPIGPDVTGGNGDASGHVYKIPAQVCWEAYNLKTGGAFNAASCYSSASGGGSGDPITGALPVITSSLNATGDAGQPFAYTITASNNPTYFNATGLPAGLSANTSTGVISGTPSSAGTPSTSGVTISASNPSGTTAATLILTINAPPASSSILLGSQTVHPGLASLSVGSAEAFQADALVTGAMRALSIYVDAASTARTLVAGLYSNAGGHPGTLIAQGMLQQLKAGAWNKVSLPAANVVAGAKYWIAVLSAKRGVLRFRDSTGCASETSQQTKLTALPVTWTTGQTSDACAISGFGSSS